MIESFSEVVLIQEKSPLDGIKPEKLEPLDLSLIDDMKVETKEYTSLEDSLNEVSEEENQIYNEAGLEKAEVNERECLVRNDIDPSEMDGRGRTNIERMQDGKPPLIDGQPVELHHIGQKNDGPLAELTRQEHRGPGNDGILHDKTGESEINRYEFKKEREEHWKARAEMLLEERG